MLLYLDESCCVIPPASWHMSTTDCSLFSFPCLDSPQILLPFSPNTSRTPFFFHSLVSWFHCSTSPVSPLLLCTAFPSILKDVCPLPCSKDSLKVWHTAPYRNTQQYGLIPPRVVKTWTSCERRNDVPTPRFNLKSRIPRHSWHSPSAWLFPGLVWLLPRPDCRRKAMLPWKLHSSLCIASRPAEDLLFWAAGTQ